VGLNSAQNLLSSSLLYKSMKIKIYITIINLTVSYGCETRSLPLREERIRSVFEDMMLRRIFWFKRDKVTAEWRRLHNVEINERYSPPNITRMIK
jgi:hypothetical protein